jgi:hypothetical protein
MGPASEGIYATCCLSPEPAFFSSLFDDLGDRRSNRRPFPKRSDLAIYPANEHDVRSSDSQHNKLRNS